ncbi:50S ribosomal protein L9 [Maridesulfovibrio bastinii]|uniref:50S ribosomal protein L9 n=1 Tax=Maridesulfovibrio bastinii TaxID=47157 RepID=UPI00041213EB|nr:50S ribosomal protein L9 [Maridesulfovibrio bastinii]
MKLILRADVDALGSLGEIVSVKPGYGRNYLIPQGLAMPASEANIKQFELEKKRLQALADSVRAEAEAMAEKLAAAVIKIEVRVGEGDKLYGSVTATNISETLAEQGIEVDRRKIMLSDPIRSLGEYEIEVKLHPAVRGEIKVAVTKHGKIEEEPESEPTVEETAVESEEA